MQDKVPTEERLRPIAIAAMVSGQGRGSNLNALIEACSAGEFAGQFQVVIGTRADAPALELARNRNVVVKIVSPKKVRIR